MIIWLRGEIVSELDIELPELLPEPQEGGKYVIEAAEIIKTIRRGLHGVRVILRDAKGERYATMLWIRSIVGPKSKIGAFIKVLGKNVAKWKGKRILIKSWKPGNREIEVIPRKKGK